MYSFILSLAVLIIGYFTYAVLLERVFGIDRNRKTPAITKSDGVDFVPMPIWKVFLIQFLNIAGLGPIFGAIMGIQYGPAAFIWIAIGTIFAGAVHDFFSGAISLRSDGASLPEIVGEQLGMSIKQVMRLFSLLLMILVGAVFVLNPAQLLEMLCNEGDGIWTLNTWITIIFVYYMMATLLPIDKLIGNLYPIFGFAILFMAVGIFSILLIDNLQFVPEFTSGLENRYPDTGVNKMFPMMFVSIACGAISGFHATQSPMMARCMKNEKYARPVFYGAMVAEGIVALIWAAAAIAFFKGDFASLSQFLKESNSAAPLVNEISVQWLGTIGGALAIIGVIAAPITSGDTALRCARLIVADALKIQQAKIWQRLAVSIPIFICTFIIMKVDFGILWRYFGWCNQTLAVFTLWAITMYLANRRKAYIISLIPAIFMTMVSVTYIIFAPEGIHIDKLLLNIIEGPLNITDINSARLTISIVIAAIVTGIITLLFFRKKKPIL